jgi:uncharacterized protein with HEPN domain
MTRHNDTIRFRHMLDHAQEAVDLISGWKRGDLQRDGMLELALVRLVEIVGEAAARVSSEGQEKHAARAGRAFEVRAFLLRSFLMHWLRVSLRSKSPIITPR